MTEVTFHFNVPDRPGYACRLLRKATRSGALVVVTAGAAELAGLDRLLWTFDPIEFLPHVLHRRATWPASIGCSGHSIRSSSARTCCSAVVHRWRRTCAARRSG